MKKSFLPALLAAAALLLTLPACDAPAASSDEDIATTPLPPLPPKSDTSGGKADANLPRELNNVNATEDIKKMQPQM
jgi:hypothetical protein